MADVIATVGGVLTVNGVPVPPGSDLFNKIENAAKTAVIDAAKVVEPVIAKVETAAAPVVTEVKAAAKEIVSVATPVVAEVVKVVESVSSKVEQIPVVKTVSDLAVEEYNKIKSDAQSVKDKALALKANLEKDLEAKKSEVEAELAKLKPVLEAVVATVTPEIKYVTQYVEKEATTIVDDVENDVKTFGQKHPTLEAFIVLGIGFVIGAAVVFFIRL
jgi:phage-related protein